MKHIIKYFCLFSISLVVFSGCQTNFKSGDGPKKTYNFFSGVNSELSTGAEYKKLLSMNFLSHSDSFGIKYDFCDSQIMKMKAQSLSFGNEVLPTSPYNVTMETSLKSELIGSWQFLNYALRHGSASQKNLANLHFYYECWIHQSKDKDSGFFSTVCKNQFTQLMSQIINGCKTDFVVEFSPEAFEGSGLSGLALDSSAQGVIYSFLRNKNNSTINNKFLIVGEKEQAIKVANFMNVQAGIEKNRLKIIISDKMDEGSVGLFIDNPDTRYCFSNSNKNSHAKKISSGNINDHQQKTYDYSSHNEISEEKSQNDLFKNEINFNSSNEINNLEQTKKMHNESLSKQDNVIKKNERIVERVK
jgi:hypothetical protein